MTSKVLPLILEQPMILQDNTKYMTFPQDKMLISASCYRWVICLYGHIHNSWVYLTTRHIGEGSPDTYDELAIENCRLI